MDNFDEDGDSYITFLQDQVRRLNGVLKEYQKKFMPIREPDIEDSDPAPPWLTNNSVLTPLMLEYDEQIRSLKDQVNFYKKEHTAIKESADKIVEENSRLHEELKRSIENQLNTLHEEDGVTGVNQEILDNLHHQLGIISRERENYKEMWEHSCREIKEIQNTLQSKARELVDRTGEIGLLQDDLQKARKYAESLQRTNNKMKLEHEQYLQSAQLQDREIDNSREELRRCRTELRTFKLKNEELLRHLDKLQSQVKLMDHDSQRVLTLEKTSENTIKELQNNIIELESRAASMTKEIGKLRIERNELEETVASMQRRNVELEDREYQATIHVRDSVQLVENALLEREQAVIREQQKSQEVKRVQDSYNSLLKDAERRKQEEIEALRSRHQQQMERLTEEMQYLEMEGAEKQAQLERVIREKSSVEKELEKLYQEGPSEASRAGMTFEELHKKLLRSEVARDELKHELDQLRFTQRKSDTQHENDVGFLKAQLEESSKRIRSLQDDIEKMSGSRMQLLDEIDVLKRSLGSATLSKNESELKSASEVSVLKQRLEVQGRDFESRIRATEDINRKTINELREMLSAQQRIGTKWREESKTMTQKYEGSLNELKNELERVRKKNEELVKRLNDEQERTDELDQDLLSQKAAQEKLQRMAADAEARADAAGVQVQTLLNRERQLLQERKELNLEIDRLKLEATRSGQRSRGISKHLVEGRGEDKGQSPTSSLRYTRYNLES